MSMPEQKIHYRGTQLLQAMIVVLDNFSLMHKKNDSNEASIVRITMYLLDSWQFNFKIAIKLEN
jgi:hypothetical protein